MARIMEPETILEETQAFLELHERILDFVGRETESERHERRREVNQQHKSKASKTSRRARFQPKPRSRQRFDLLDELEDEGYGEDYLDEVA